MSDLSYSLMQLNQLSDADAAFAFSNCCTAQRWIQAMVAARPFSSKQQCLELADEVWRKSDETDFLQAFEGHPKIGDVSSLKAKYAHTKQLASGEQGAVNDASDDILERLAQGNNDYYEKNGFIFIVCASGKSAAEMLGLLEQRLPNSRDQELLNAAAEQAKITAIRINKLLPEEA